MLKKERYNSFIEYFSKHQPEVTTELDYKNPYQLIVAVILSAQCTDKRVNIVTPALFKSFPTIKDLAASNFDELFPYIKSISYPNNKTRHLLGMACILEDEFGGKVPDSLQDLQK